MIYDFINPVTLEEKQRIAENIKKEFERMMVRVIEAMAEKEGRKGDMKTI